MSGECFRATHAAIVLAEILIKVNLPNLSQHKMFLSFITFLYRVLLLMTADLLPWQPVAGVHRGCNKARNQSSGW